MAEPLVKIYKGRGGAKRGGNIIRGKIFARLDTFPPVLNLSASARDELLPTRNIEIKCGDGFFEISRSNDENDLLLSISKGNQARISGFGLTGLYENFPVRKRIYGELTDDGKLRFVFQEE